ncbi:4-carboxymuconolactone decarboxylase [Solirhodobacter olei]|uniref:4-carboxymuconolactone decarboxylase n=1 Tax=Solirhodobacter olei TaxID=2493082 RepID=UPI000FDA66DC|nr:4-carboxymuconolactone decarboxylase [Solirhodobacter olei]
MSDNPKSEMRKAGEATRRRTLGDAHVNRSQGAENAFAAPFIDLITEAAWGHVWSRDTLTPRERSLVTLSLLAGLGNWEEFELHLRATANTGASRADVQDALLHVAIYAGVPRANTAFKLATRILDEMAKEEK